MLRKLLAPLALFTVLSVSRDAAADAESEAFIQAENVKITTLLKQSPSPARDQQIGAELDSLVDFDALAKAAFGEPCPTNAESGCDDLWKKLSPEDQKDAHDLLKQLVVKNYKKNLMKTLDYDVTYKGSKELPNGASRVKTEAKSKTKPREPATKVDYVVVNGPQGRKLVNVFTENSSLTKNYYEQFVTLMADGGYPKVKAKLKETLAKGD